MTVTPSREALSAAASDRTHPLYPELTAAMRHWMIELWDDLIASMTDGRSCIVRPPRDEVSLFALELIMTACKKNDIAIRLNTDA